MNYPTEHAAFTHWLSSVDRPALQAMLRFYLEEAPPEAREALRRMAVEARSIHFGRKVFFRGLIEFSSYCKNGCYYCGLSRSNVNAVRYRLTEDEILGCCRTGHGLGFRTFVLQSGEDPHFDDDRMCCIVSEIKARFPDSAVTLSLGERSRDSYRRLREAGADRYLLRHETADKAHYQTLHPREMRLENRLRCLYDLKELGFQVGAGFMVESPFQTVETIAEDLLLLRDLKPHMVGIGPFIPQKDTRFRGWPTPTAERTLILLSIVRLLLPKALLPATTALGTIDPRGREKGLQAGANVVMPNLSPVRHRKDYALYDNKICTGEEAAECLSCLSRRIESAGFQPDFSRGDHPDAAPDRPLQPLNLAVPGADKEVRK
jgi:biotin synthase